MKDERESHRPTTISQSDSNGDFSNFPEISKNTIEMLAKKGITSLFPIQQACFRHILER